jgi:hypothetical protein
MVGRVPLDRLSWRTAIFGRSGGSYLHFIGRVEQWDVH